MPEAATDSKSPKPPRRLKTGGDTPRQVHFCSIEDEALPNTGRNASSGNNTNNSVPNNNTYKTGNPPTKPPPTTAANAQPATFPAVGPAPGSLPNPAAPGVQWHTSADPSRSLPLPGQPYYTLPQHPGCFVPQPHVNTAFFPNLPPGYPTTPGGRGPGPGKMADYQNTAPPPWGMHYQPPVPDTTYGPMQHVYIPRFDGTLPPGAQHAHQQPVVGGAPCNHPPGYVVNQQPVYVQPQPVGGQPPVMINGQPYVAANPQHVQTFATTNHGCNVVGGGNVPIIAGNTGPPDISGLGRTRSEEMARQVEFAASNRLYEAQDFKPADDDPSRFYYVREVDGNWTQRNRFTIDHMGDCRWYVTDEGWFYAVRLPD